MKPDFPEAVRKVVRVERCHDHQEQGWTAVNSVIPTDCMPVYRATGGGVGLGDLMTLERAMDASISHVEDRIRTAQRHLDKLKAALSALGKPADEVKP